MAQLSMFEKQKHDSKKDFTCSIGQFDMVYITFRNKSWKRFTTSEHIAVYIGASGALKFDSPDCGQGVILKMKTGKGHPEIVESTRYVQLSGKKWPQILDVVRKTAGSYDFPEKCEDKLETKQSEEEEWKELFKDAMKKETRPALYPLTHAEEFAAYRNLFVQDISLFLNAARSPEERVEIWKTFSAVYGITPEEEKKPKRAPTDPYAGLTEGFEI